MADVLSTKIDFAVILKVERANPNGDPLNGNRPRTNYENQGEISDVCLKRKIRNRLLEDGEAVFVQSNDYAFDEYKSLKSRAEGVLGKKFGTSETRSLACEKWLDVRSFGQLFAMKGGTKGKKAGDDEESSDGSDGSVSIGIRGPVTIREAVSIEPIEVISTQITKSVNSEDTKNNKKSSDTMGMKHRVEYGIYVFKGSMNPQLAERTGFSDVDAEKIKKVLPRLFENDASSARPEGSMEVLQVLWWKHNSKSGQYSSAKVHNSFEVDNQGNITRKDLPNLSPEVIFGF